MAQSCLGGSAFASNQEDHLSANSCRFQSQKWRDSARPVVTLQHLTRLEWWPVVAVVRHLFDWLVNGQAVPANPAHTVHWPRYVVTSGQTSVLDPAEAARTAGQHRRLDARRPASRPGRYQYAKCARCP